MFNSKKGQENHFFVRLANIQFPKHFYFDVTENIYIYHFVC